MSDGNALTLEQLCDAAIVWSSTTDPNRLRQSALKALQDYAAQDETRVRLLIALTCAEKRLGNVAAARESGRLTFRLANEIGDPHLVAYSGLTLVRLLLCDAACKQESDHVLTISLRALGSDRQASLRQRLAAIEELRQLAAKTATSGT